MLYWGMFSVLYFMWVWRSDFLGGMTESNFVFICIRSIRSGFFVFLSEATIFQGIISSVSEESPAVQGIWFRFLGWKDLLEKG